MDETRPRAESPKHVATPPAKPAGELKGAPLYLRWLSLLCALMALFCVGVFIIGYKDPSFGRVATLAALIIASTVCWWLSKRKAQS